MRTAKVLKNATKALKNNTGLKSENVDAAMKAIKTTMSYENQDLTVEETEMCKEVLAGNLTGDDARKLILKQLEDTKLPTA